MGEVFTRQDESDDDGGAEGGEEGGSKEAAEGSFAAVVTAGARIKLCMGLPAKWYGALVGPKVDQETVIGFDDGDARLMPTAELEENFKIKTLLAAVPSEGGVVANKSGYEDRAVKFLTYEHRGTAKIIGLFTGDAGVSKVAGLDVYSEIHISPDAFEKKATRGAQSMQDRLGLHSFCRGDGVEYTQAVKDEVPPSAYIYGVVEAEAVTDDLQLRRMLVLYDKSDLFFFGTLPAWGRVPKPGLDTTFDCENDDHQSESRGAVPRSSRR